MAATVTIRDIARQCGCAVSTVSRAINNHPDVNPVTRERILAVIEETGFVPNDSARYLKRTETNAVALLVKGITNAFFSPMIRDMEDYVQQRGYATILRHVGGDEDEVVVAQALVKQRRLKGIVFLGGRFTHDPEQLRQLDVPFIFSTIGNLEERPEAQTGSANVAVDDVDAARKATEHLAAHGHQNIGILAEGLQQPSVGQLRFRGYQQGLSDAGIPYHEEYVYQIVDGDEHYTMRNGYEGAQALMQAHPEITAIFCVSDVLALGALRGLVDLGLRVPEDVSVIGFDGIEAGQYSIPSLTTIRQPVEDMSHETISLLFDMIDSRRGALNIIMPAELVIRESTGPVRE